MTDLVYDYISMGVDMLLTAAIISSIVVLLRSSVVLSIYQSNLQANSDRMNYYRQYNMYDRTTTLCAADIQSALVYYRYDLQMVVENTDGRILITNINSSGKVDGKFYTQGSIGAPLSPLGNINEITGILKSDDTFSGWLIEDLGTQTSDEGYEGGLITGLKFKKNP